MESSMREIERKLRMIESPPASKLLTENSSSQIPAPHREVEKTLRRYEQESRLRIQIEQ
jgi:hypothetical protein